MPFHVSALVHCDSISCIIFILPSHNEIPFVNVSVELASWCVQRRGEQVMSLRLVRILVRCSRELSRHLPTCRRLVDALASQLRYGHEKYFGCFQTDGRAMGECRLVYPLSPLPSPINKACGSVEQHAVSIFGTQKPEQVLARPLMPFIW